MRSLQPYVEHLDNAVYHGGYRPTKPDSIIIHCTGGDDVAGAIGWLNSEQKRASYHYLIDKAPTLPGGIVRMLPPEFIAWHAGVSWWPTPPTEHQSMNARSIGIAFVNDNGEDHNPTDDALTDWQREAAIWLCVTFMRRYGIGARMILAHREVAPGRKVDPLPRICDMDAFRGACAAGLAQAAA